MTRADTLLDKARNHPRGLSFRDFKTLMKQHGWKKAREDRGSHEYWFDGKNGPILPIQNLRGKAKEYQVKQFLRIMQGKNS